MTQETDSVAFTLSFSVPRVRDTLLDPLAAAADPDIEDQESTFNIVYLLQDDRVVVWLESLWDIVCGAGRDKKG